MEGFLPVDNLDKMGPLIADGLLGAVPLIPPIVDVGAALSQADFVQEADRTRFDTSGVDGTGIIVGVLSDSYDRLGGASAGVTSGDLPSGVNVVMDSYLSGTADEGRAMIELIYDLAPGSDFAFATAFGGEATFAPEHS